MPNTATIKGNNTVLFGSASYYSTAIIVSGNKKLTGDKLEVLDEVGFVIATIYFNDKNEFSFEMIVQTAAPVLTRGEQITVAGVVNALVDDTEELWAQNDVRKFRVNATKYTGMTFA